MKSTCVLAGDIGGTKTFLCIYEAPARGQLRALCTESYPSQHFSSLEEMLARFRSQFSFPISAAAFGIPGPVVDGKVAVTNLPWLVEQEPLGRILDCPAENIRLMNDLETTAVGSLYLPLEEIHSLQAGKERVGNRAVIAAGTGLGQAFLFWDGRRYHPSATEGGHADFPAQSQWQQDLVSFLSQTQSHVDLESVLSGPGLLNVFRFLTQSQKRVCAPDLLRVITEAEDPGAIIGSAALARRCETCAEAVALFLEIYGQQAGNLALTVMAVGGIYFGGGIIVKLLPLVQDSRFLDAFCSKYRFEEFMKAIPMRVILNPKTSVFGAGCTAAELVHGIE